METNEQFFILEKFTNIKKDLEILEKIMLYKNLIEQKINIDNNDKNKKENIVIKKENKNNENKENKKLWSDIVEEEEKIMIEQNNNDKLNYEKLKNILKKDFDDIKLKINKIEQNLNENNNYKINDDKYIKFNFTDFYYIFQLHDDKYNNDGIQAIRLNPIPEKYDIVQYCYHDKNKNLFGVYVDGDIYWYKIDFKERLVKYYRNEVVKYLYYCYTKVESYNARTKLDKGVLK